MSPCLSAVLLVLTCPTQEDLTPDWVTTEPEMPAEPAESETVTLFRGGGGGYLHTEKLPSGKEVTRIVIRGQVVLQEGIIEVFVCADGGKDYESAILCPCDVQQLDLAMVLHGMKKGRLREREGVAVPGEGSRVIAFAQWKDEDGKLRTCRVEDLVHDRIGKRKMPRVGWTYVGAWEQDVDPNTGRPTGAKFLRAVRSRTLIATYHDTAALLDNPLLRTAADDQAYNANGLALPPSGTPIRIILRLPTEQERQEMERIEQEVAREP
jgi:hypothetical protein